MQLSNKFLPFLILNYFSNKLILKINPISESNWLELAPNQPNCHDQKHHRQNVNQNLKYPLGNVTSARQRFPSKFARGRHHRAFVPLFLRIGVFFDRGFSYLRIHRFDTCGQKLACGSQPGQTGVADILAITVFMAFVSRHLLGTLRAGSQAVIGISLPMPGGIRFLPAFFARFEGLWHQKQKSLQSV